VAASSGLTLEDGFVAVDRNLQSVSDPRVFAAGDVAAISINHAQSPACLRSGRDRCSRRICGGYWRGSSAHIARSAAFLRDFGGRTQRHRVAWALFAYGRAMWRWKNLDRPPFHGDVSGVALMRRRRRA
jgi:hypothetical protein